jgi:ribosome-associated protein
VLVEKIPKFLDNKKAEDIHVLDVTKTSPITRYIIIASSQSSPHTRALADAVDTGLEKMGYKVPNWHGKRESNWMILDLGSIIVHVMGKEERQKYSLEDIWGSSGITYHL